MKMDMFLPVYDCILGFTTTSSMTKTTIEGTVRRCHCIVCLRFLEASLDMHKSMMIQIHLAFFSIWAVFRASGMFSFPTAQRDDISRLRGQSSEAWRSTWVLLSSPVVSQFVSSYEEGKEGQEGRRSRTPMKVQGG